MAEVTSYSTDIQHVSQLDLPWQQLDQCNILITGATGLIGSCLVEVLMNRKGRTYHVYACGRNKERAEQRFADYIDDPAFHFVRYDVLQPLQCDTHFQYIIHAASNASPNFFAQHPVEVMKSNFDGVCHLIDYGRTHGLQRFLYVSTGEVYGEGDGREFTEDYSGYVNPMLSRNCYPSSKRASETLCAAYAAEYGIDTLVVRPSHTYGPHFTESDNRVYAQFIRNVLQGEDIVMKSTGSQFRSWCYVVDCVSAILHVLLKGQSGEAYNIADGDSNISIRQLAEMIAEIGDRRVIIQLPSDAEKAGYNLVTKSVFSTQKLEALGWSPMHTMRENMEATIKEKTPSNSPEWKSPL